MCQCMKINKQLRLKRLINPVPNYADPKFPSYFNLLENTISGSNFSTSNLKSRTLTMNSTL